MIEVLVSLLLFESAVTLGDRPRRSLLAWLSVLELLIVGLLELSVLICIILVNFIDLALDNSIG